MAQQWAALLMKTGPDKEKQNILWNMAGSFCYAFASMVLSVLVMSLAGEDQGGIFAFGYSTLGQQMFILAYFGIRPFHITDGSNEYRFGDYLHHRYMTCAMAAAAGGMYLLLSGYTPEKAAVIFLLVCYKTADGLADVYESEFQRNGNLHLTGKSNTFRTLLSVSIFLTALVQSGNLILACAAAVGAQAAGILIFDVIVIRYLPGVDFAWDRKSIKPLTAQTILLFVSVFLDFYIFSAAKYAIDSRLNDAASGYFSLIFMPSSVIYLVANFVIRPFLTRMTMCWNQGDMKGLKKIVAKISGIILGLTVLALGGCLCLGGFVLRIMERLLGSGYEGALSVYQPAFTVIVLGGGFYALANLMYYCLVVMRRQRLIFLVYLVTGAGAAILAPRLVSQFGIPGAAFSYCLFMVMLLAGFGLMVLGKLAKTR